MTIQAQPPHTPGTRSGSSDRPTRGIDAQDPLTIDAFSLLDHRTRGRTILLELAPPGRYLSIEHHDEVRLIPLDRPIIRMGRGLSADVRLEDPQVSRRHAILAQGGDGARVLDDRSWNGTFVNGRAVTAAALSDGDVLRLGRLAFRFVEIKPQLATPRPLRRIPLPVHARAHVPAAGAA